MKLENDNNKVWVNIEATVNLGNYENMKISMGESITVLPDDDSERERKRLAKRIIRDVKREIINIKTEQEDDDEWN